MGLSRAIIWLLAATLVAAACADDDGEFTGEPTSGAPRAEVVDFTTEDGIGLSALSFGSGDTAVVLAHMQGSGKEAWTDVAVSLANNGYVAFAFDFRGYGGQDGEPDTNLELDITAAITAVRAEGAAYVYVAGASMGGTAALAAGAEHKLEGVVTLSAPLEFAGIDAIAAASLIEEPALFIAAAEDEPYVDAARTLADVSAGRFVEYEGTAHGTDLIVEHREKTSAQIIRFVDDPLKETGAGAAS